MPQRFARSRFGVAVAALSVSVALASALFGQETHAPASGKVQAGHVTAAEHGHAAGGSQLEAGEEAMADQIDNPLELEPALIFWTLVVFLGLLGLLGRYAWKPLLAALHDREHSLQHTFEETERARQESEATLAEHRALMARAADDVRGILEKARVDAQSSADQIVKAAQAEAEASRLRAVREINTARDQALTEIWTKSAEVAVSVAGKVLSKQLGGDEHRRLLDAAILELPGVIDSTTSAAPAGSQA